MGPHNGPTGSGAGPLQQLVHRPGVHDPLGLQAELGGTGTAVDLEVELPGGVGVAVDGEQAAGLEGDADEVVGRVAPFGPGVDLHRHPVLGARTEHRLGVELALRAGATTAAHQPTGAVPEHVGLRMAHRGHHPARHRTLLHAQL